MKIAHAIAILLFASSAWAQSAPQTVLFVCEHGAVKSVVAAAHFNRLAAERAFPFRAVSRGTAPDSTVPARIGDGLALLSGGRRGRCTRVTALHGDYARPGYP